LKRAKRRGYDNPHIEKELTTQLLKGKVQKDKQRFKKYTLKSVVVLMNIPLKKDLLAMVKNEKINKIYITNK
jgi:hypothetical protein